MAYPDLPPLTPLDFGLAEGDGDLVYDPPTEQQLAEWADYDGPVFNAPADPCQRPGCDEPATTLIATATDSISLCDQHGDDAVASLS